MQRMRAVRADIAPHDSAARLKNAGVDVFLGSARFVDHDVLEVDGKRLRFRRAVIATGARPAPLPVEGLEQAGYLTSETLFHLTRLPARLLVVGAGPIGCEMAQAFQRLGSAVTLVDRDDRVLPHDARRASTIVEKRLEQEGVDIRLGVGLDRVEQVDGATRVHFNSGDGPSALDVDAILLAVGRRANVEGLGLESAGVDFNEQGVVVDQRLRTSNRHVYAAGDVCSSYKFTHAADAMARVVLKNALFYGRKRADSLVIPWATYTDPEVAHVGISAEEASERGLASLSIDLHDIDRAQLDADEDGYGEVHYHERTGRIAGATLVSRHAGELVSGICLAMNAGVGLGKLSETIYPYPTEAEIVKRLADSYNRTRLTPVVARWFERFFRWLQLSSVPAPCSARRTRGAVRVCQGARTGTGQDAASRRSETRPPPTWRAGYCSTHGRQPRASPGRTRSWCCQATRRHCRRSARRRKSTRRATAIWARVCSAPCRRCSLLALRGRCWSEPTYPACQARGSSRR